MVAIGYVIDESGLDSVDMASANEQAFNIGEAIQVGNLELQIKSVKVKNSVGNGTVRNFVSLR